MISDEYPGSVADIEVLRRHVEVNRMLGGSHMLADKWYRCDTGVPHCFVASEKRSREKTPPHRRVVLRTPEELLHCLFGNLGTLSLKLVLSF